MTTSITFEVGTLADSIRKAALVAPSRAGNAFDKAAGIVLEITPDEEVKCLVKATNLEVFYLEVIDCITASGPAETWRLPSGVFSDIVKDIKPAPGKTLTLIHTPGVEQVKLQCGRMRASLGMIDPEYFPEFLVFDGDMGKANNIASRIEQVAWATAKTGAEPLTGIHFTGSHVCATDGYRFARVPLEVPIAAPVTVPAGALAAILRQAGEVHIAATDTQLVIKPDDWTQIVCTIYGMQYPNISRPMGHTYDGEIQVSRQQLLDMIAAAQKAAAGDRSPLLQIILGKGELAVFLKGQEAGLGDVMELPGQANHPRFNHYFNPSYLADAIGKAPADIITLKYKLEDESRSPLKIESSPGFEACVAPRKATT